MKRCVIITLTLLFTHTSIFAQDDLPCEYSKRNHLFEVELLYDLWLDCSCNELNYRPSIMSRETSNIIDMLWMDVFDPDAEEMSFDNFLYSIYQCDVYPDLLSGVPILDRGDFYSGECGPDLQIKNDSISPFQITVDS